MNIDACYQLGHVIKPHGIRGSLKIFLDVDIPENYSKLESVYVELNQKLIPFFIKRIEINPSFTLVDFEEIDSIDNAKELKGARLFLPLSKLPSLEKGKFYYHELIGHEVIDNKLGKIGFVKKIDTSGSQELLIVEYQGKEILIPFTDDIVSEIQEKTIQTKLPNGLLDLYL